MWILRIHKRDEGLGFCSFQRRIKMEAKDQEKQGELEDKLFHPITCTYVSRKARIKGTWIVLISAGFTGLARNLTNSWPGFSSTSISELFSSTTSAGTPCRANSKLSTFTELSRLLSPARTGGTQLSLRERRWSTFILKRKRKSSRVCLSSLDLNNMNVVWVDIIHIGPLE